MKSNNFYDVDSENLEIAEKILVDSKKINTDGVYDEDLLNKLKNAENKKKRKITKFIAISASAAAMCLIFMNSMGMLNLMGISEKGNDSEAKDGSNIVYEYSEIYERMKYAGDMNDYLALYEDEVYSKGYKEKTSDNKKGSSDMESYSYDKLGDTEFEASEESFYDTNEQTEDVHEGDVVKTDGKYIYTFIRDYDEQNYKIIITQVEGKTLKNVAEIKIKDPYRYTYDVKELYVDNDVLIAVGTRTNGNMKIKRMGIYDYSNKVETIIFAYDISNRENPVSISENVQDGEYVSSRLSDRYLYTISDKTMGIFTEKNCVPEINGKQVWASDVYLPETIDARKYTVITSLDLHNLEEYARTVAVAGGTSNIYVSNENIYLIENSTIEYNISDTKDGQKAFEKYTFGVYDEREIYLNKETIKEIKETYEGVEKVSAIRRTEANSVQDTISIIKYSYSEGDVDFIAEQTVEGHANDNMFFDEKDGYLRFVTTEQTCINVSTKVHYYDEDEKLIYSVEDEGENVDTSNETNNLFVLDEQLNVKAEINGLAEGESVYSARYLGDYGYFVTYENTDPLFSVDFSDIDNPKIIGELKMPGYSQYLHFYTENELFGFGMETDENSGKELGLKLEMYNVTGGNAKTNTKLVLEDIHYSSALDNYKSLMIDSTKNLIGFVGENYDTFDGYYYLYTYKKGEFSQLTKVKLGEYYWSDVRGFYINDYFYIVIPEEKIIVLSLENYEKVGGIKLK